VKAYGCGFDGHYELGQGWPRKAMEGQAKLKWTLIPNLGSDNAWCHTLSFSSLFLKQGAVTLTDARPNTVYALGTTLAGHLLLGWKDQSAVWFPSRTLLPPCAQIAGTCNHPVHLTLDGRIVTGGPNAEGTLANGERGTREEPKAVSVPVFPDLSAFAGKRVIAVDGGYGHCGCLFDDGTTAGWGENASSQVGDGTLTDRLVVTQTIATEVVAFACLWNAKLYLKADGRVSMVGNNNQNQSAGAAPAIAHSIKQPLLIPGLEGIIAVAGAGGRALAVDVNGDLFMWGADEPGPPRKVLDQVSAISAGCYQWATTCLAVRDGEVWAQGRANYGQIGDGTRDDKEAFVPTGFGASVISAGETHSLALA
jgi:alpha-tubulin suppressor-like RCC1 family protein